MSAAEPAGRYAPRVEAADWAAVTRELDESGAALLPRLLTPAECAELAGLYGQPRRFRATVDMARHRFGSGQYRYFAEPFPEPVAALRSALYELVEQRPRAQSRGTARTVPQGHGLVFTTRDRPVRSARGWSAAPVRHGVSTIRSGCRFTLGLVFHDAR